MSHWLRPKELQSQYQESQKLFEPLETIQCNELSKTIVAELYKPDKKRLVRIEDHVFTDAQVLPWLLKEDSTSPVCQGTLHWLKCQLQHPIHDRQHLQERQQTLEELKHSPLTAADLTPLTGLEGDVLWALHLPPMQKTWPLPLLFPQWFALRWMNHSSTLLELYHLYRIYGATASHLIYPLTLLLGPWWYVRTKLKWKLPFKSYISFLKKGLVEVLKYNTGDLRAQIVKFITVAIYIGVYLYGVIQSVDIAYMLYNVRRQLKQRLANIHAFVSHTDRLWKASGISNAAVWGSVLNASAAPIRLSKQIGGIYQLFRKGAVYAEDLKTSLMKAYVLQGLTKLQASSDGLGLKTVRWLSPSLKSPMSPRLLLTGMAHPMLPDSQQTNPMCFSKNLILTGPNAAGKSSFVRSLLANVLMAQTFGVCFADKAAMTPIHTIASFMRVYDVIGTQSLFEAECRRSLELIQQVAASPRPTLLFLDEPMHATPPIEGAATAMALVHYLAGFKHVRLMITTHYHLLAQLEKRDPKRFRNISMEASINPISFTYRIQAGPSFQSIAIEMLEKDAFPEAMLKDAIEIKNKICLFENNESQNPDNSKT